MSRSRALFGRAVAVLGTSALAACGSAEKPSPQPTATAAAPQEASTMQLTSPAFAANQLIPQEFTCDGAGTSPPLRWSVSPANAKSLALVVEDPDAPKGTFYHWGVYDLPPDTHELAAGASNNASAFKQTKNDFGKPGYGPPCPPKGDPRHHYHFRLLALDVANLPGTPAKPKDLLDATQGHVVGTGELVALYGR